MLGLEDSAARMARIAKSELHGEELPSIEEIIRRVDAVTLDDVHDAGADAVLRPRDPGDRGSRGPVAGRRGRPRLAQLAQLAQPASVACASASTKSSRP